MLTYTDIASALDLIRDRVLDTPFLRSRTLSDLFGANLFLKFENLQFTSSFKERGALNKLLSLTDTERAKGVVAMSAGNHAQGVAYHASRLGIPATIVMTRYAPATKVEHTKALGATVVLEGASLEEAGDFAHRLARETGAKLIHPYDDEHIIAGQGTVAIEMLRAEPDLDVIVVPVGGGGLISGVACAAKSIRPDIKVIGVQSRLYPSMAMVSGHWTGASQEGVAGGVSVAEGIAVAKPGEITARLVGEYVDDMIVVDEAMIEEAVALLLEIEKTLCEGAGAAGLAAVMSDPDAFKGRKVGVILSGGNIDVQLLARILQRHLVRSQQFVRLRIRTLDVSGALGKACTIIGDHGGNIVSIQHERIFAATDAKSTQIDVDLQVRGAEETTSIVNGLAGAGFEVELTDPHRGTV